MKYKIQTKNIEAKKTVISYLYYLGYSESGASLIQSLESGWEAYEYIAFDTENMKSINGINSSRLDYKYELLPFDSVFTLLKPVPKHETVKLNEEHSAVVSRCGIKVGCQTFPLSIIDDLLQARERILREIVKD